MTVTCRRKWKKIEQNLDYKANDFLLSSLVLEKVFPHLTHSICMVTVETGHQDCLKYLPSGGL